MPESVDGVQVQWLSREVSRWTAEGLITSEQADRILARYRPVTTLWAEYRVEYGIESYFVPEGRGREIERARHIAVEVALREGHAVIRRVYVDGHPFP